MNRKFVST